MSNEQDLELLNTYTTNTGTTQKRRRQPEDYQEDITQHSTRAKERFLYPGIHYRSFAQFLSGQRNSPHNLSLQVVTEPRRHVFAAIHDLARDMDDPSRVKYFDSKIGMHEFKNYPSPQKDSGQLLFLRGFPSPEWVNVVGAKYRIDPEFFRRHLGRHLSIGEIAELYDIPALPSASQNTIKLSITSIGKQVAGFTKSEDKTERMKKYYKSLGTNPFLVGESIVRRFSIHDKNRFTIEQDVSICYTKKGEGWIVVILLDCGRDLDESPSGPWLDSSFGRQGFDTVFNPVLLFEPNICFHCSDKPGDSTTNEDIEQTQHHGRRCFQQSSSLLHTKAYGHFMNPGIMKVDPFYALSGVFNFAAYAESQFLSLLKKKFLSETHLHNQAQLMKECLLDLKQHKLILHEHIQYLKSVIDLIKAGGNLRWPHVGAIVCSNNREPQTQGRSLIEIEAETMSLRLLKDYESLHSQAQALSDLYSEGMRDIRDNAMLAESQKAIEQARGVGRLTLLAYLFLPLSFTSSIFGMNFKELGDQLSIWVWVVVSVIVFIIALTLCFWQKLQPIYAKSRIQILLLYNKFKRTRIVY